ncbi:MAG: hypothetical protein VR78_19270 [Hoeflea sp. BRH_c9]|nr:MAG: hypothetical protein VR78_19270 [Hoeflea sp. BRH_c9]MDP2732278.1 DUF1402 family protein [Hoeflea sp.]
MSLARVPVVLSAEPVPAGNRSATQPGIPGASTRRTKATKSSFDAKYEKIRDLIADDAKLRQKIVSVSKRYKIDPIHIVGALVGEHTYNVDAYDRLQTYYVKAISYAGESFRFEHEGESVVDFVKRPEFEKCDEDWDSAKLWTCREDVWETEFRGQKTAGKAFPDDRFGAVFFQPFYAGQTFGLGQLNPLTALIHTDRVSKVSGLRKLSAGNAAQVYKAIMDPDSTLAYMAASIADSIENYRDIAGFDISGNPGLTATLYNVGNTFRRARELAEENSNRKKRGLKPLLPRENYYGWLVNTHEDELRAIIER